MSPLKIVSDSLYLDRTVQDWHRRELPEDATAIDLDLMGACSRCYEPLYLIESATFWGKPTGILRRLAAPRSEVVPTVLIVHDTVTVLGARLLEPVAKSYAGAPETASLLLGIRRFHMRTAHGVAS